MTHYPWRWNLGAVLLALLLATAALGADGDVCALDQHGSCVESGSVVAAGYPFGRIVTLCDAKAAAGDCSSGNGVRLPLPPSEGAMTFRLQAAADCSAVSVSFDVSDESTGSVDDPLPFTLSLSSPSTTIARGSTFPGGWYLFTTVDTATDCTDLTVVLHLE